MRIIGPVPIRASAGSESAFAETCGVNQTSRHSPLVIALYVNAVLLAAILVVLCTRGTSHVAYGAGPVPQPIAGGANLYLMPAQFSANRWGCYVLDIDAQTLLAYYYSPKTDGTDLQLVAARKIAYDRDLTNFNSTSPSWMEVKKMVDLARQQMRGNDLVAPAGKSLFDNPGADKNSQDPKSPTKESGKSKDSSTEDSH